MSSSARSRRSISKQRGAAMSSRLMPPNVGAAAFTNATISSTSVVSMQSGKASTPANSLNSIALPSITGIAASGPMSPRPSTAVPSETTATVLPLMVSAQAALGSSWIAMRDARDARRVGHREVVAGLERHLRRGPRSCRPCASGTCGRRRCRRARRRARGPPRRRASPCSESTQATVTSRTTRAALDAHEVDRAEDRVRLARSRARRRANASPCCGRCSRIVKL